MTTLQTQKIKKNVKEKKKLLVNKTCWPMSEIAHKQLLFITQCISTLDNNLSHKPKY